MIVVTLAVVAIAVVVGVYIVTLEIDAPFQLDLPRIAAYKHTPFFPASASHDASAVQAWKKVTGPESIAFDDAENLYAGLSDGRVVRIDGATVSGESRFSTRDSVQTLMYTGDPNKIAPLPCTEYKMVPGDLEPMCGRPLGMAFDAAHRRMVVIDAYLGLMEFDTVDSGDGFGKTMTPLTNSVDGTRIMFGNAVVVSADGNRIYFTSSSSRFTRAQFAQAVLAQDKTGRVLCFDRKAKSTTVIADGIAFANGLVFADVDESALLVVATNDYAIVRVSLAGDAKRSTKTTQTSVWASNLPCVPDNVHWDDDKVRRHLVVGCYTTRASDYGSTTQFALLARSTLRRWMTLLIARAGPAVASIVARVTNIVVVLDGRTGDVAFVVTDRDSGSAAERLSYPAPISAAVHHDGTLYLGSVVGATIARVPWNLTERLAAAK